MADTQITTGVEAAGRGRRAWLSRGLTLAAVFAGLAVPTWHSRARAEQPSSAEQPAVETDEADAIDDRVPTTTITAQEMSFDVDKRISTYKGDVHIAHTDVDLYADTMIVTHDKQNQPTKIEAVGAVRIQKGDKLAESQRAEYLVDRQVIILTGNPRMLQGPNSLVGAERLMFYQSDGRFQTAGGRVHLNVTHKSELEIKPRAQARDTEPAAQPGSTTPAP